MAALLLAECDELHHRGHCGVRACLPCEIAGRLGGELRGRIERELVRVAEGRRR